MKRVEVTTRYLEMKQRPRTSPLSPPRDDLLILELKEPSLAYYRFLYNTVGEPWHWIDRRRMRDEELVSILRHPRVRIFVLYVGGEPGGYAELDGRQEPDVELAYFGLMPDQTGQGLGPWLMQAVLERVFDCPAWTCHRFWLHTCSLDHPKALAFYQDAGFTLYKEEVESVELDSP